MASRRKEIEREMERKLVRGVGRAMIFLRDEVKKSINIGNITGKEPSAPGEPPRKVTAALFKTISVKVKREANAIIGNVGTNIVYGPRLELGFVGTDSLGRNINQAPRPFLRPAQTRFRGKIKKIIIANVKG